MYSGNSAKQQFQRVQIVSQGLDRWVPNPRASLNYTSPFALLIATLLSAQCHDEQVNRVMPILLAQASTPEAMRLLSEETLGAIIHSCGFFRVKSRHIIALSKKLCDQFNGQVPNNFSDLEQLPGVGHKTASVVMGYAFGHPAFPVDTHVYRLAKKWHLSKGTSVKQVEADLKQLFPQKLWFPRHIQMITFGRSYCNHMACKPNRLCPICKALQDIPA